MKEASQKGPGLGDPTYSGAGAAKSLEKRVRSCCLLRTGCQFGEMTKFWRRRLVLVAHQCERAHCRRVSSVELAMVKAVIVLCLHISLPLKLKTKWKQDSLLNAQSVDKAALSFLPQTLLCFEKKFKFTRRRNSNKELAGERVHTLSS